jgi:hypothetical protein
MTPTTETDELVSRIVVSRVFSRSDRLRKLLVYIAARAAAGRLEELSEQRIGERVFGRPEGYHCGEDNVVRTAVRQLRGKLKEYFETEGAAETLVLEIPKGGYVPTFLQRESATIALSGTSRFPGWLPWVIAGSTSLTVLVLSILLLRSRPAVTEHQDFWAEMFSSTRGSVHFVLTDSYLAMGLSPLPNPTLDEYIDGNYFGEAARHPPAERFAGPWRKMVHRRLTSLADVTVLTHVLQGHPSSAQRIDVRHARDVSPRDFKSGNFVLTGGPNSNPWFSLFSSGLGFEFTMNGIRSRSPRTGERAEYLATDAEHHWSLIAYLPNLSHTGEVLLIAGLVFEGTEGAGDFLSAPESIPDLRRRLALKSGERIPPFEAILETTSLEGTARTSRLAAVHRL